MKIELIRHPKTIDRHPELVSGSVSGALYINGTHLCDTEENPLTALPAGAYQIIRHYCKQYGRFMPLVQTLSNSPLKGENKEEESLSKRCALCISSPFKGDRRGSLNTTMPCICPMLKPGNGIHHRADGSIILGTRIIPGCLSHPLQAFNPLAERIRKAIARGHEVHLVIKESLIPNP